MGEHVVLAGAAECAAVLVLARTELLAEQLVVALGNAEEVGDHEQRERLAVPADELVVAAVDELVELPVGEAPHELLVLLQALRGDQPHQQRTVRGVHRRVEGQDLIAERQLAAVLLDQGADVVALQRDREPRERSGRGVARRERRRVGVDRDGFVVAGHHHHVVMRLSVDRALRAQPVEVVVRIGDEVAAAEEVGRLVIGHAPNGTASCTDRSIDAGVSSGRRSSTRSSTCLRRSEPLEQSGSWCPVSVQRRPMSLVAAMGLCAEPEQCRHVSLPILPCYRCRQGVASARAGRGVSGRMSPRAAARGSRCASNWSQMVRELVLLIVGELVEEV